jgi:hypothetical protein
MKSVIIHALLAVFGLGFAYQTWARKPEEETAPGSVVVAECSPDAVQKLTLDTPTQELTIEPKRDKSDTKYWITTRHRSPEEVSKRDPAKKAAPGKGAAGAAADEDKAKTEQAKADEAKPDPGKTAEGDAEVAKKDDAKKEVPEGQRPKRFLANATFSDYLKQLTPVRAQRSLGKLPKTQDADFGFDKVGTILKLECGGRALELDAGSRAFGANQRYLRDPKSETTYLFDEHVISDLESAQFKFMQSDLHEWKNEDVEEVTIAAQGAKRRLLHRDRKLAEQALWVDEKAPAKRNELYNNWFGRLGRLRARAYLAEGADPGSDLKGAALGSTPVLEVDYKVAERPPAKLEVVRVDENGVGHYYARTETTRGWVSLYDSAAKEVEQDVGMVVGVEQPPAQGDAASKPGASNAPPKASPHGALPSGNGQPLSPSALPAGHPQPSPH